MSSAKHTQKNVLISPWINSPFIQHHLDFLRHQGIFQRHWHQISQRISPQHQIQDWDAFFADDSIYFHPLKCYVAEPHIHNQSGLFNHVIIQELFTRPDSLVSSAELLSQLIESESDTWLITGDMFSGKTTLLFYLFYQTLVSGQFLPCYVEFTQTEKINTLNAIWEALKAPASFTPEAFKQYYQRLNVPWLIMLELNDDDSFDQQLKAIQQLQHWLRQQNIAHCLILTRTQSPMYLLRDLRFTQLKDELNPALCLLGFEIPHQFYDTAGTSQLGIGLWQQKWAWHQDICIELSKCKARFRSQRRLDPPPETEKYTLAQALHFLDILALHINKCLGTKKSMPLAEFEQEVKQLTQDRGWFTVIPNPNQLPEITRENQSDWELFFSILLQIPWLERQHDQVRIQTHYHQLFNALVYFEQTQSTQAEKPDPWLLRLLFKPFWGAETHKSTSTRSKQSAIQIGKRLTQALFSLHSLAASKQSAEIRLFTDLYFMGHPTKKYSDLIQALKLYPETLFEWGELLFRQATYRNVAYIILNQLKELTIQRPLKGQYFYNVKLNKRILPQLDQTVVSEKSSRQNLHKIV